MKAGKITLSLLALAALVVGTFGIFSIQSAFAANNAISGAGSTVVVNGLVSITLSNASITFAALDPGVNDSMAVAGLGITVDAVTNVDTSIYLNASDFNASATTMNFSVSNLKFRVSSVAPIVSNASCASTLNCSYNNSKIWAFNDTARLGTANTASVNHWIAIPAVQAPGTYTNTIRICAQQAGTSVC